MKILLTNDDGVESPLLARLAQAVVDAGHEAVVVAPKGQRSGVGHAFTYLEPLHARQTRNAPWICWEVDGTPADCVKFAVTYLLRESAPDLVISGVNDGHNLGVAAVYSGTVAGAREGALFGLPAVAISVPENDPRSADYAIEWAGEQLRSGLFGRVKRGCVWNVNFPAGGMGRPRGVKAARMGLRMYDDGYSPAGVADRFVLSGEKPAGTHAPGTDDYAVEKGWISLCPLQVDQTDDGELERLSAGETPTTEEMRWTS